MEALSDHWGPILIAVISAAGTAIVTLLKIRGDKVASVPSAYQGLMQEMKDWTNTQLEQRDRRIEELQSDVGKLQETVTLWKGKFRQAMEYIRVLRAHDHNRDALPPVPESLRNDLNE